ncbi:MAG: serine hydrolase domain-containing protein [Parvularculaceae bacterium]
MHLRFLRKLATAAILFLAACAHHESAPLPSGASIDAKVAELMAREDVKGLALAVIDGGKVTKVAAYGWRNVEKRLPLTTETVMYGASLTKTATAYLALQLVDEGLLDLDAPLASYLPKALPDYEDYKDLAGDDRWKALTARMVLTHSTGFANFRWLEDDGKLRFHFQPGTRYAYSGEGFYILQLALEEGLGLDLETEARRRLFEPFGMTRTSLQWRADFASDLADGYALDGSFEPHDERSSPSAAGSMDTSIADQARLWAAVMRGEGLSKGARAELVRPQRQITSARQFPTLAISTDPRTVEYGLSAGLGLVTYEDPGAGPSWFKGGHNDWTGNMLVCQERRRRCVVLLSNSVRAERIYPELVRVTLGETKMPWWWEYGDTVE